jgi:hypothetical protein
MEETLFEVPFDESEAAETDEDTPADEADGEEDE